MFSVFLHKVFLKEFEEFTSGHCIVTVSGIYKIVGPPKTDFQNRSNTEQRIDFPVVHFLYQDFERILKLEISIRQSTFLYCNSFSRLRKYVGLDNSHIVHSI